MGLAKDFGRTDDPVIRQGLAKAHCRAQVLGYLGYRLRTAMSRHTLPGPEVLTMPEPGAAMSYAPHVRASCGTGARSGL